MKLTARFLSYTTLGRWLAKSIDFWATLSMQVGKILGVVALVVFIVRGVR